MKFDDYWFHFRKSRNFIQMQSLGAKHVLEHVAILRQMLSFCVSLLWFYVSRWNLFSLIIDRKPKLSYVAELPSACSNLNHQFYLKDGFESVIQIWTGGMQFKFINIV